jgi:chromosome condensin MukBEF MukE localization factor
LKRYSWFWERETSWVKWHSSARPRELPQKADNQIRDLAKRDVKSLVISALNDLRRATKSPGESGASSSLNYSETVRNISMQVNAPEDEVEAQLGRLISSGFLGKDGNILDIVNAEELDKLDGYFKR